MTGTTGPPRQQLLPNAVNPPPARPFLELDPFTPVYVVGLYKDPHPLMYCLDIDNRIDIWTLEET